MRASVTCLLLVVSLSFAQKGSQLSSDQILSNIEAHFEGIQDYTVTLDVALDMERLKVPKMKATMYFKQPDKVHFQSEGFALLPKEGIAFTPGSLRRRFTVDSVKAGPGDELTLTMRAKAEQSRLRKAHVVVNTKQWTISRLSFLQFDGRSLSAEFLYARIENRWLPSQVVLTFASDSAQTDPTDLIDKPPGAQRPSQVPRKGSVTVRYSDYKLNTGLSDELFEQDKKTKQ